MARGQSAWLVTWEWAGPHAAVEDRIAAILRPRLSERIVGEIVECLYARHAYHLSEMAAWARRPAENPYPAQWYEGHCFCGGNPSLHAKRVRNLVIVEHPQSGLETVSWVSPPRYRLDEATDRLVVARGEMPASITRTITGRLSDRETGRYSVGS